MMKHAASLLVILWIARTEAFSSAFGIGALLFQPKGLVVQSNNGDIQRLLEASDFFVEAFWVGKVGGGAKQLSPRQRESLKTQQFMEFRGRYAGVKRGQSELIICQTSDGEMIGCAGVEVSPIPENGLRGPPSGIQAPLMSNVAVSQKFRRRGIGEKLVKEVEAISRQKWGYDDIFLYVERRNPAAVKLYEKLGYRKVWVDKSATTLLPTERGNLQSSSTTIVCMRKRLGRGLFGRVF